MHAGGVDDAADGGGIDGAGSRQISAVREPLIGRSSVVFAGVVQWSCTSSPTRWAVRSLTGWGRRSDGARGGPGLAQPIASGIENVTQAMADSRPAADRRGGTKSFIYLKASISLGTSFRKAKKWHLTQ